MLSNLRSVVTQVNRGGRSIYTASRRNLHSAYESKREEVAVRKLEKRMDNFCIGTSFVVGYCGVLVWEFAQLLDYAVTMRRVIEQHDRNFHKKTPLQKLTERYHFFFSKDE